VKFLNLLEFALVWLVVMAVFVYGRCIL